MIRRITQLAALAAVFVVVCLPGQAQQDPRDNKALEAQNVKLKRQVDELHRRLNQSDDQALELARAYDKEKRRLQEQTQNLLEEMARVNRDHALQVQRLADQRDQARNTLEAFKKESPEERIRVLEAQAVKLREGIFVKRMQELKKRKVTLAISDDSLTEVLDILSELTGVPHAAVGADPDQKISLRLVGVSYTEALTRIAEEAGATWDLKECIVLRPHPK